MIPIKQIPADIPAGQAASGPAQAALAFLKPGSLQLTALPPLSLYVHFPWCVRKCPYCDFNSHEVKGSFPEEAYLDALRCDLEQSLPLIWGRKIHTIFIGGGTPSLLSAAGLDRLLSDLRTLLPFDGDIEITMEANPGTFEADKFRSYRDSGISRLSIGIQSFNGQHLHALGRIHDGEQARKAVEIAQANFDNFNLDLMYALPQQTLAEARTDIETAIAFAPPHLSLYHLTLEPNTLFAKYPPPVPDDDASADMQDMIAELTTAAGYVNYEVSAYAQPKRRARHNLNYWQFGDYLGIGAGAHSKLSFPHRIVRQMRYKHPQSYLEHAKAGTPVQEEAEIGRDSLGFEFMLNALRLTEGFSPNLFAERTGMSLNQIEKSLNLAEQKGMLYRDHALIKPTDLGRRFLNDLQEIFLSE
ncbi:radical SAM family heme chaperone HemW [Herbaspirillum sp.]|jgi:putative oxygen-independent coproporphyrinogen III oxidase|uniref:radical SAM family heme chaperone HemW n=1 Tax=Herbaspirillum TaxID=963 RepID=UPI0025862BA2|nr:radical SAM family heme chaperone HemW [Herbaspirillum sp.]MCP3655150.1 oxygen-independent coproporphyrinogen III oxidase-like protein [Herbaspirillum sp.]MCP3945671.1 oxygen-independent coproporphyrinogen III oxidase-like protein [Herbaspirillum sp.]MCP4031987.1 oxygen-independent coproporphyrinogen III oxidase-like protein [Herbaspirillum sp.]MCP4558582.1 oxygen-independent coproporphyrinogen III oxidase-like protein [Herbaspirillum sp.]